MRRLAQLAAAVALTVAAPLAAAPEASGAVYWGAGSAIGAANLDGSMPLISYPYEIANIARKGSVCGVAVNGTDVYWADSAGGAIGRMGLSPSPQGRLDYVRERVPVDQSLIGGLTGPCGVAIDGGHLYWADTAGFAIGRANLDGSDVRRAFIGGIPTPCGVAVDAAHVYWGDIAGGRIGRANLDGSEPDPDFITGADLPCGVAADGAHLYWSDEGGAIGRARLDGGDPEPHFIAGIGTPCGVAVDAGHLYWAERMKIGQLVGTANIDGSGARSLVATDFYGASCGVALDARRFTPPPPPGSRPIRFGPISRRRHGRVLVIPVYVPARGELAIGSPKLGWSLDKGPEPPPWIAGSFRWKLTLWLGGGRTGKRIRQQLRRTGRAPVSLDVYYQEVGRAVSLTLQHVAFLRPGRQGKQAAE
jgi:hypothetical protein